MQLISPTRCAVAVVTAYADVAWLPEAERDVVTRAVARNVMIGRGNVFAADQNLTRGELARALALAAGMPQRIPTRPSFIDVGPKSPIFPYVESVAGARARLRLIDEKHVVLFAPDADVTRLDFAVALVRGARLEAEAQARAGESLGFADENKIPPEYRGYVAVALERGLIDAWATDAVLGGPVFDPKGKVPRLAASRFLLRLLDLR